MVAGAGVLLALVLAPAAMAGSVAVISVNDGSYGASAATPVSVAVGDAQGQAIAFTNRDKSRSTSALVVSPPGNGFSIVADKCSGVALGPNKSCTVTVAYQGAGSPPLDLGALCRYYGSIATFSGGRFIACGPMVLAGKPPAAGATAQLTVAPKTPPPSAAVAFLSIPTQLDAIRAAFKNACLAGGYPASSVQGYYDTTNHRWVASATCDQIAPDAATLCAAHGQVLQQPLGSLWQCSGVALPDQTAVNALATQFQSLCYSVFGSVIYSLDTTTTTGAAGLRATFTCTDPIGLEPATLCRHYGATPAFTPDGKFLTCRILYAEYSNSNTPFSQKRDYFQLSCEANGYPTAYQADSEGPPYGDPLGVTRNYYVTEWCSQPYPEAANLCSANGADLTSPGDVWQCFAQLPDQGAADALATQFRSLCNATQPAGSYRLHYSSSGPGPTPIFANYTCDPPNYFELCSENSGVLDYTVNPFQCSDVALPDQAAVNALAAKFEPPCDGNGPPPFTLFNPDFGNVFNTSTIPNPDPNAGGLLATFTCS
jgi:hypothetical protein